MDNPSASRSSPPRFFKKMLHWFCATDLLEELEGDLEEVFEHNLHTKSKWYAKYRYAREVVHLLRPSVIKTLNNYNINSSIMITNYGKVAYRNFTKNKAYVLINVLSMSIGLACCIVSYLNYQHNTSFDTQHENINNIYRINYQQQDGDRIRNYGLAPLPISTECENLTHVSDIARYSEWHGSAKIDDSYFDINTGYVSDNFLNIFTFPMLRGSKEALTHKSAIIISKELALRLYDDINVIDRSLTYAHRGNLRTYIIEGVMDKLPSNTSFNIDAITNIANLDDHESIHKWNNFSTTFLLIKEHKFTEPITQHLNEYAIKNTPDIPNESVKNYYLDPLDGMANRAVANDVIGPLEVSLPWAMEVVPGLISLLILLISCFTFTNTSIASAASRLKEIGIRKVMGSRKSQIVFQFLLESLLVCVLAIIVAIPLAKLLAAQFNQLLPFLDLELIFSNNTGFFSFMAGLVLLAGLIAGSYPALYLSKFQPTKILKGNLKYKSAGRITKILLTFQFAFAMVTITSSVLFIQNAHFQDKTELGFDTEKTIVVRFGNEEQKELKFQALHNVLAMNPKITELTSSVDHVARRYHTATVSHAGEKLDIVGLDVGPNYINTIELNLTQGRDFDEKRASDYKESVIVNELFVKQMGWSEPLGKKLIYQDSIEYFIIGVVKDFYFDDFSTPIQPLWLRFENPSEYNYLIAKTDPINVETVMSEIKMSWRNLFNSEIPDIKPPEYARYKGQIINSIILKILIFMGSIAAIMSMIGFFSLVSLNLFGRMKEIGVRRVLGSSTMSVIKVINRDYIMILLLGIISGSLISHFAIPLLMNSLWAYHTDGSFALTILSILLMLVTCIATVSVRVVKATNVNPVDLLQEE